MSKISNSKIKIAEALKTLKDADSKFTDEYNKAFNAIDMVEDMLYRDTANDSHEQRPVEYKDKQRVTIHLSIDLIERIKNMVYWEPGVTITGFCEEALSVKLKEAEGRNKGPYKQRKEDLKGGRPIK